MCFIAHAKDTEALKRRMRKTGEVFFKTVTMDRKPAVNNFYPNVRYSKGSVVHALPEDRIKELIKLPPLKNLKSQKRGMGAGIYVYIDWHKARENQWGDSRYFLVVECRKEDLLGANTKLGVACFTKVKVIN